MVLMQFIIERITGQTLDQFVQARVFGPLGMRDTQYNPPESLKPRIAPTETEDFRGGQVWGVVHDETAWVLGGVSGNAGLFSSARDLAVFVQMLLNGGSYGGNAAAQAVDGGALDGTPAPGRESRVRLGHAVAAVERGPILLAAELRSHGLHGDVDLGGSGARAVRRAAHEPCEPDARQPEDRSAPSCRRRRRAAVGARFAAPAVGGCASPALADPGLSVGMF